MSSDHRKLLVPCSNLTAQEKRIKGRSLKATGVVNTIEQRLKTDFQCKSTFFSHKNVLKIILKMADSLRNNQLSNVDSFMWEK